MAHTKDETLSVLAKYFRHTTVASFVRQLNVSARHQQDLYIAL